MKIKQLWNYQKKKQMNIVKNLEHKLNQKMNNYLL